MGRYKASISNERLFDAATSADAPIMNRSEASFDWKMETLPQPLPTQGRAMLPEGKSSIKVVPVTTPNEIFCASASAGIRKKQDRTARVRSVAERYLPIYRAIPVAIGIRIAPNHTSNLRPRSTSLDTTQALQIEKAQSATARCPEYGGMNRFIPG